MKEERKHRRKYDIIVQRPEGYDINPEAFEEIWADGVEEIWDAERELNTDEIPFHMNVKSKQILSFTRREAARTIKNKVSYIGKYRQGTISMVINYKNVLFVVIIFRKGGVGVTERLNELKGNIYCQLYLFCSESGNMTYKIWLEVMVLIQNATKEMRMCARSDGRDWKKAVVLNIDNYGVHLNSALAENYANIHGIFIRCLLRNCSHLQQPIDQHVGQYFKLILKKSLRKFSFQFNDLANMTSGIAVGLSKWREIVVKLVVMTMSIFNYNKKYILAKSYVNLGIYLLLNGTQDGLIETLHQDSIIL